MRTLKKTLKIIAWVLASLFLLLGIFCLYVWAKSDIEPPEIGDINIKIAPRIALDKDSYMLGDNWIRKNEYGLYEMFTIGPPYERGLINGKLSRELIVAQEEAFTQQIRKMIPSPGYLKFLKYMIGFMNRDLPEHVLREYQQEIYGVSRSASDSFQWIGSNYFRQLNYHGAHDIGHALQNLMLVGCTSFGAWDTKTENGAMLLGRNFDFWMGDDFAKNKIVSFVTPSQGHPFAFITWGGFIGVVSGMNTKGLTVTINAARSSIPTGAATPVSLVAREILQYAGNIQEAVAIAHRRKMFVSESFLIGSAADHKSVIVEKTPDTLSIYDPASDQIICTNHYQSEGLKDQQLNREQMKESASVYRYRRTRELLQQAYPLTPQKVAAILRDTKGIGDKAIGIGNEKSINQMIAHHSIIFMPDSLRMWVSTSPWQLGSYICYDLRKVFAMKGLKPREVVAENAFNIAPDSFLYTDTFRKFMAFRHTKMEWLDHLPIDVQQFIGNNSDYYDAYRFTGDYWKAKKDYRKASVYYKIALTKEIATYPERKAILDKLVQCERALR